MHVYNEGAFHVEEVRQHAVVQLRGEDLQKADRAHLAAHAEAVALCKFKGTWGDEVLDGQAGGSQPVPRKAERLLGIHVEHPVQQAQALHAVQGLGDHAEALEVVENVRLHTLQTGLGRPQRFRLHAEGQVLGLNQAVVALGELVLQHGAVLVSEIVESVRPQRDGDAFGKAVLCGGQVQKRELKANGAVEVVEEIAPRFKDGGLVLVLIELIVDVLKLDGFGVIVVFHPAYPVREHTLKWDTVLRRQLFLILPFRSCDGGLDLLFLGAGQLSLGGQYEIPPYRDLPAVPERRRSYRFGTGAASGEGSTPAECFG